MSCRRPAVDPQTAHILKNLPEKIRVSSVDHLLYGVELPVHGWHHLDGQIHLIVTLPDGSRGYFPADRTALLDVVEAGDLPALQLTSDAVRQLRLLVQALQARGKSSRERRSK